MKMNSIEPLNLWIKNFLSYGNNLTSIPLNFKSPTLIIGSNLDDVIEGQIDSNGSGKSTIINAVAFVYYDETIGNKIKKDKLINYSNKKDMLVASSFKKNENGNDVFYYIERFRKYKAKGGDGIRILKNTENVFDLSDQKFITEHDITQDSIDKANKQLIEILGMSFDIFSRIVIYSGSHESFFSLPVTSTSKTSQSDILEQLFDMSIISEKSENLKKIISTQKTSLNNLTEINKSIIAEKNRWKEQFNIANSEYENWIVDNEKILNNLINKNNEYKNIDFTTEYALFDKINKLSNNIQELNTKKQMLQKEYDSIKNNNESYSLWNINRKKSEDQYAQIINEYKNIDFNLQYDYFTSIKSLESETKELSNTKINIDKDISTITKEINSLSLELKDLSESTCPYCKQHFSENENTIEEKSNKLEALISSKKEKNLELTNLNNLLTEKLKLISEIKNNLLLKTENDLRNIENKLNDANSKLENLVEQKNPYSLIDINETDNNLTNIVKEISEYLINLNEYRSSLKYSSEKELNTIESELKFLNDQINITKNLTNPHTTMLDNLKNLQIPEEKTNEINDLEKQILHDEFLYKLLTKKDSFIRKNLLKKNLSFLNTRLHFYLNKIGLPHKVQFNTDLTTSISKFNTEMDYENLSTGQKARINIALSFAFRDVLQKLHGKISLCILDECLDYGLGNAGIQMAAKMIKSIAASEGLSIFVISHRDEISGMFESKLEIEYKSKFSKIVRSNIGVTTE